MGTALDGLHVTGKYMDRSMQHTCCRHAAWDPHKGGWRFLRGIEEAAAGRRGNSMHGVKKFHLKARTSIWFWLSLGR